MSIEVLALTRPAMAAQRRSQASSRGDVVRLEENLGFGAANNFLAERACGRRLLLLNPDTVVLDGAVDKLWAFAETRPRRGSGAGALCMGTAA
ncbi:MAG: hypothetical protein R3E96_14545 [Planctomycetota bacterium]